MLLVRINHIAESSSLDALPSTPGWTWAIGGQTLSSFSAPGFSTLSRSNSLNGADGRAGALWIARSSKIMLACLGLEVIMQGICVLFGYSWSLRLTIPYHFWVSTIKDESVSRIIKYPLSFVASAQHVFGFTHIYPPILHKKWPSLKIGTSYIPYFVNV